MKVLFIFAHPDDESLSSGGTICKLSRSGATVKLITATKGEVGSVGNPPLCSQEKLGEVREKELRAAAKILGISQIYFLGLIDGTLHKVPLKKIEKMILPILEAEQPDVVVTFNKTGGSNHPDHKAMSKAATNSFKKYAHSAKKYVKLHHTATPKSYLNILESKGLAYTAFGKVKGIRDSDITTVIDISDTYNLKVKAVMCHKTQHQDWERFLRRASVVNLKKEYFKLISENQLI